VPKADYTINYEPMFDEYSGPWSDVLGAGVTCAVFGSSTSACPVDDAGHIQSHLRGLIEAVSAA